MMERYWLFSGEVCHPEGGMKDFRMSGADVGKLIDAWKSNTNGVFNQWCHVLDTDSGEIVEEWEYRGSVNASGKFSKVME